MPDPTNPRKFLSIGKVEATLGHDPFGPLPQPAARLQLSKTTFGVEIEVTGNDWNSHDVVNVTLTDYPHAQPGAILGLGESQADARGRFSQPFDVWFFEPTPALEEVAFTNHATLTIKSIRDPAEPRVRLQIAWYWFFP
jgi:hypothetical protein